MVLLPSDPNVSTINTEFFQLQVGSNPDTYSATVSISPLRLSRPEIRKGTTAGTAYYYHGAGDNQLLATLLMSKTEYGSFITNFTRDGFGNLPILFIRIKATDISQTTMTIGQTGNTPQGFVCKIIQILAVSEDSLGAVEVRLTMRLTEDSVTTV